LQTQHISYIWSLALVSAVRSRGFSGWTKATFVIVLPLLIVLMVAVGPSSAVLMIPRPNLLSTVGSVILTATPTKSCLLLG
jgi:hypothetical protein